MALRSSPAFSSANPFGVATPVAQVTPVKIRHAGSGCP